VPKNFIFGENSKLSQKVALCCFISSAKISSQKLNQKLYFKLYWPESLSQT
jgi:hypothetical protein